MPVIDYLKPRAIRLVRELLDQGPVVVESFAILGKPRTIRYDLSDVRNGCPKGA